MSKKRNKSRKIIMKGGGGSGNIFYYTDIVNKSIKPRLPNIDSSLYQTYKIKDKEYIEPKNAKTLSVSDKMSIDSYNRRKSFYDRQEIIMSNIFKLVKEGKDEQTLRSEIKKILDDDLNVIQDYLNKKVLTRYNEQEVQKYYQKFIDLYKNQTIQIVINKFIEFRDKDLPLIMREIESEIMINGFIKGFNLKDSPALRADFKNLFSKTYTPAQNEEDKTGKCATTSFLDIAKPYYIYRTNPDSSNINIELFSALGEYFSSSACVKTFQKEYSNIINKHKKGILGTASSLFSFGKKGGRPSAQKTRRRRLREN